jgi:CBS domain-containing protein
VTVICPACDHDNLPGEDVCAECDMDLAGLDVSVWGVDPCDPLVSVPLREIPLKAPLLLGPDATVSQAIALMTSRGEGCVFVEGPDHELIGVLTERDVTSRVAARGRDPEDTRLEQVMTPNPVTLRKDDPLAWALHRMGVDGHRHLPVLDDQRLIGFLSVRSVLRLFLEP